MMMPRSSTTMMPEEGEGDGVTVTGDGASAVPPPSRDVGNGGEAVVVDDDFGTTVEDASNDNHDDDDTKKKKNASSIHRIDRGGVPRGEGVVVLPTLPTIENWEKYPPAVHLTPMEWNERLLRLSSSIPSAGGSGTEEGGGGGGVRRWRMRRGASRALPRRNARRYCCREMPYS